MNFFSVCIIVVAVVLGLWLRPYENDWPSFKFNLLDSFTQRSHYDFVIGILSSRDHFELRQSVRDTWLQLIQEEEFLKERIKVWFIVGTQTCLIPPSFRTELYSCEPWSINIPDDEEISTCEISQVTSGRSHQLYAGFQFKVIYPIVVTKLGVLHSLRHSLASITIYNAYNKEEIVSVSFHLKKGAIINGYDYRAAEPFVLPKNFEGIVIVENVSIEDQIFDINWNDGGGMVHFTRVFENNFEDGAVFHQDRITAVSFFFTIYDKENLTTMLLNQGNYQALWEEAIEEENAQIQQEAEIHGDILLVDLIDTYRNLPSKLLLFFKSIMELHTFKFAMKTDDDCFINIPAIYDELTSLPKQNAWWSRFRNNWGVERFGKWREIEYTAPVYPCFACGGGYVLSSDLVHWLVKNRQDLHIYQGEDVSLGIWLAAINPRFIHDTRWQCDNSSSCSSYNLAQLNETSMYNWWLNYRQCGKLCPCDNQKKE